MAYEVHLSKAAPRTSKSCQQVGGASGVTSGGHGPQSKMTLGSPNPAAAPRHCLPAASRPSHQVPWPPACPQTPPGHLTPGSPAARPHACGRYRFSVPARHRTRRRYLLAASLSAGLGQCLRPSHSAQPSAAYPPRLEPCLVLSFTVLFVPTPLALGHLDRSPWRSSVLEELGAPQSTCHMLTRIGPACLPRC